jgi:hypothetical protein
MNNFFIVVEEVEHRKRAFLRHFDSTLFMNLPKGELKVKAKGLRKDRQARRNSKNYNSLITL